MTLAARAVIAFAVLASPFTVGADAQAAANLEIDLSNSAGSQPLDPGQYTLTFTNKIPTVAYKIDANVVIPSIVPAPFDISLIKGDVAKLKSEAEEQLATKLREIDQKKRKQAPATPSAADGAELAAQAATMRDATVLTNAITKLDQCQAALGSFTAKINAMACEASIPTTLTAIPADLVVCDAQIQNRVTAELKAQTREDRLNPFTVPEGADLTIKIATPAFERSADKDDPHCVAERPRTIDSGKHLVSYLPRTWEFGFQTVKPPKSEWLVFYGLNYIDNQDKAYFGKSNGTDPATYTITKKTSRSDKSFAPSLYFMWLPGDDGWRSLSSLVAWRADDTFGGLTAGVGFDFDNPAAFLGYGLGWGYNVMLNAGLVYYKASDLAGQYQPGDVVNEALNEDQLTDEGYEGALYVGLAFRFGGNPFPAAKPQPTLQSTEPAKPAK